MGKSVLKYLFVNKYKILIIFLKFITTTYVIY